MSRGKVWCKGLSPATTPLDVTETSVTFSDAITLRLDVEETNSPSVSEGNLLDALAGSHQFQAMERFCPEYCDYQSCIINKQLC